MVVLQLVNVPDDGTSKCLKTQVAVNLSGVFVLTKGA